MPLSQGNDSSGEGETNMPEQETILSEEYKQVLLLRFKQNLVCENEDHTDTTQQKPVGLGRYLRASRMNRGLTYASLAQKAGIAEGYLIAIESGLFLAHQIPPHWLEKLSIALNEDERTLHHLLYQFKPKPYSYWGCGWKQSGSKNRISKNIEPSELYYDK